MATKPLPSQNVLNQLLRYEPETGFLFWKHRPSELFNPPDAAAKWNGKWAGEKAFASKRNDGYCEGAVFDVRYLAHRVIWKMIYGIDPDQIDHIDGDRSNNKIDNLRSVSDAINKKNKRKPCNNTSGHIGVSWDASRSQWEAHIHVSDRKKHLGRYSEIADAVAARRAAEIQHNFHPNHGRD